MRLDSRFEIRHSDSIRGRRRGGITRERHRARAGQSATLSEGDSSSSAGSHGASGSNASSSRLPVPTPVPTFRMPDATARAESSDERRGDIVGVDVVAHEVVALEDRGRRPARRGGDQPIDQRTREAGTVDVEDPEADDFRPDASATSASARLGAELELRVGPGAGVGSSSDRGAAEGCHRPRRSRRREAVPRPPPSTARRIDARSRRPHRQRPRRLGRKLGAGERDDDLRPDALQDRARRIRIGDVDGLAPPRPVLDTPCTACPRPQRRGDRRCPADCRADDESAAHWIAGKPNRRISSFSSSSPIV